MVSAADMARVQLAGVADMAHVRLAGIAEAGGNMLQCQVVVVL